MTEIDLIHSDQGATLHCAFQSLYWQLNLSLNNNVRISTLYCLRPSLHAFGKKDHDNKLIRNVGPFEQQGVTAKHADLDSLIPLSIIIRYLLLIDEDYDDTQFILPANFAISTSHRPIEASQLWPRMGLSGRATKTDPFCPIELFGCHPVRSWRCQITIYCGTIERIK